MNLSENLLIQLIDVCRYFILDELETRALDGINLSIFEGDFISIGGPSGCGKSTLLSILGLLDSPTKGTYLLNGKAVHNLARNDRARIRNREIGFIFQSFNLVGDMSVLKNVELPLLYQGIGPSERKQRAIACLEKVNMDHRTRHFPAQLSGGQQQRVAVARALVTQPRILLADEPTGNLDSANGEAVMELLMQLNEEGTTICMVTHDSRYQSHASRNIPLFDGRIQLPAEATETVCV